MKRAEPLYVAEVCLHSDHAITDMIEVVALFRLAVHGVHHGLVQAARPRQGPDVKCEARRLARNEDRSAFVHELIYVPQVPICSLYV